MTIQTSLLHVISMVIMPKHHGGSQQTLVDLFNSSPF
jgi:hypothetical protein